MSGLECSNAQTPQHSGAPSEPALCWPLLTLERVGERAEEIEIRVTT